MITDLKDLLNSIGYDRLTEDGSFWRTRAVYRDGDNVTALRINKRTGDFQDFVDGRYGSIHELVKLTLKIDAIQLKKFYEGNKVDLTEIVERDNKPKLVMEKTWNDSELQNLLPHYKFYEARGISKETLKFFKSGFAHSGSMNQRYVFPIYRQDGLIHGWTGRDMTGKSETKWKHIGKKAQWIYPAFVTQDEFSQGKGKTVICPCLDEIIEKREVILVESIGDMMALWERGIKNVLVTFGLMLSSKLGSFLMSLSLDRVVICSNNDFDGEINRGKNAAIGMFIDLMSYCDFTKFNIALPLSNDFGCINEEQFEEWKERKKSINPNIYLEVLEMFTALYRANKLSKTEIKFAQAVKNHHEQI